MPKVLCLYADDSGTRNPNHDEETYSRRDWFALGGILINEEDESKARDLHAKLCDAWDITYPLHSEEIRHKTKKFSWLRNLSDPELDKFMGELGDMLASAPCLGHACVVDRPGYDARYREKYGRGTWLLCRTAFSVICERSAKFARKGGRKLRVFPEDGDASANRHLNEYYQDLKREGMPFAQDNSTKYGPLTKDELADTLYSFRFKKKTSPLIQIADLYLYPICRARYEKSHRPYDFFRDRKKLIDDHLPQDEISSVGIKYSCFEKHDAENTKAGIAPGFSAAPVTGTS